MAESANAEYLRQLEADEEYAKWWSATDSGAVIKLDEDTSGEGLRAAYPRLSGTVMPTTAVTTEAMGRTVAQPWTEGPSAAKTRLG
jgi:hypothetical protein